MILTIGLSVVIGLVLGLLGGGGSILTVPMLVYVLNLEPKQAILTSFVVVGLSSLLALIPHAARRQVCWKSGGLFGLTGMLGAYGGGHLAGHFSGDVLMSLFGLICLIAGISMMCQEKTMTKTDQAAIPVNFCPVKIPFLRVLFDGFFVGAITGMVGVGGGFLIVPALDLLVGLPIQGAVGTSLLIIAMNAAAGLTGYSHHVSLDWHLTLLVAIGTLAGSGIGALLSAYVKPKWLRRAFGVMVVLIAGYVLSQSLTTHLFNILELWVEKPKSPEWGLVVLLLVWLVLRISKFVHKVDENFLTGGDANYER
jgi:uncharacterized membrane protein YfcA